MSDIKRYNLDVTPDGQTGMFANDNGYWVSYPDHRQKLEEVKSKIQKQKEYIDHLEDEIAGRRIKRRCRILSGRTPREMVRLKRKYSKYDYVVGQKWVRNGKPMIIKWVYGLSKHWVIVCWKKTIFTDGEF